MQHWVLLSLSLFGSGGSDGGGQLQGVLDDVARDADALGEQTAGTTDGVGQGGGPPVLDHEDGGGRTRVETFADEVEVLGADEAADLTVELGEAGQLVELVVLERRDPAVDVFGQEDDVENRDEPLVDQRGQLGGHVVVQGAVGECDDEVLNRSSHHGSPISSLIGKGSAILSGAMMNGAAGRRIPHLRDRRQRRSGRWPPTARCPSATSGTDGHAERGYSGRARRDDEGGAGTQAEAWGSFTGIRVPGRPSAPRHEDA